MCERSFSKFKFIKTRFKMSQERLSSMIINSIEAEIGNKLN